MHQLRFVQRIPCTPNAAWEFFSRPENLKVITPGYMRFEIVSGVTDFIYPGTIIRYRVRPFLNIPVAWTTEITHVTEPTYFVDEQRFGPFRFWHHKHFFNATSGGVEMIDVVDYQLPMGWVGQVLHRFVVRRRLEDIFQFRRRKLIEIFGPMING